MNRMLPAIFCSLVLLDGQTMAQEWTRFRGPNGTGLAPAADSLPVQWTERDFRWKVAIPGIGHSSPVLWGDRLFVTSGDPKTGTRTALCFRASDGTKLWQKEFPGEPYHTHGRNSFATSTPAVDAQRLYLAWGNPEQCSVTALDHDGKEVWRADLGPYKSQHGFGASPIVYDGLVVLVNQPDGNGELVALDGATGQVRWKTPRRGKNATYATPCVFQPPGRAPELIFTNWQHGITGVEPKTGKVLWEISVFEVNKQERAIASPVVAGDLVIGTCGFVSSQKHFVAVRPGNLERGDQPREVWRVERAVSYLPTPLVRDGLIFLCSEQGVASCLRAATGEVVWQERMRGSFSASPVCAGDHIYLTSDAGDVTVIKAAETFEVLGEGRLGEPTQSTPAIAGGRLYFRTEGHLMALGGQ